MILIRIRNMAAMAFLFWLLAGVFDASLEVMAGAAVVGSWVGALIE